MSGTGLLAAYGGMAATPASAETLQFYKDFPYKFINQNPEALSAEMSSAGSSPTSSGGSSGQAQGQGLAPGYDSGGAVDQPQPAGLPGAASGSPGGSTLSLQQLIDMGLVPASPQIGAAANGVGGLGGGAQAAGAGGQAGSAAASGSGGGFVGGPGSSNVGMSDVLGPFGGAAAPNTASFAQANNLNQGLVSGLFGAAMNLAGPAGMIGSAANFVGGVANTVANGSMLSSIGAPMNVGQYLGGFLGVNGYNGTPSAARSAMMASPGITDTALANIIGAMTAGNPSPNDVSTADPSADLAGTASADTQASAASMSGQGGDGTNDNSSPGAGGGDDGGDHSGFAIGGVIKNSSTRGFLRDLARGSGLVKGLTGGRADAVHTSVPRGSYVMPADVVSGMGGGNTLAGGKYMTGVLKSLPKLPGFKNGGSVQPVKVRLSAGEYVVHPAHAAALGAGSLPLGHMILDQIVRTIRQRVAQQALTAAPPK
jgi:hypothetical protein